MPQAAPVLPVASREKIMQALYEAAELEHTFMCMYLYAAFSLRSGEEVGLNAAQADAVNRWRQAMRSIAIDEMSHLVAAWNITSALGGAPRFGRANFPLDPGYLPAGIVVRLAPFSEAVIQHFIHLERPYGSDEPDGPGFASDNGPTRTPVALRLTPVGFDYATIGIFYETIGRDLQSLADAIGEANLFCGDPALQLSPTEVDLAGARPVTDLATALAALNEIIIEGEGAPSHRENSHFRRFIAIREEYRTLRAEYPDFVPAHPSATNPVLRKPPRPEGHVWLKDADAVSTVDLANAVYALLLRFLAAAYAVPVSNPEKLLYVDSARGLMHALAPLAERAARLPAGPSYPGCNAGISFTALRNAASLPPGPSARRFLLERIDELSSAADMLDPGDPRRARAARVLRSRASSLRDAPMQVGGLLNQSAADRLEAVVRRDCGSSVLPAR